MISCTQATILKNYTVGNVYCQGLEPHVPLEGNQYKMIQTNHRYLKVKHFQPKGHTGCKRFDVY